MPLTSLYEIPYQADDEPPNGPQLGQDLAEAVEGILSDGSQPLNVGALTTAGAATVGGDLSVAGVGKVMFAVKVVDTLRDTDTILADPHLSVAVAANAVYAVEMSIAWTGGTTPDIRWNFTAPAGATMPRYRHIANDGTATAVLGISSTLGFINSRSAITGTDYGLDIKGTLRTAGTAGTLAWCWGQNATNAIDTTVYTDSWMRLTRIS